MKQENKGIFKKYIYFLMIALVIVVSFVSLSCGDEGVYTPPTPDEVENFQKISGTHTIIDEDVSSYILIKNKPYKDNLLYSMTIYMDFYKGERTNRFYEYYQIDYYLQDDTFGYDYHLFDNIDGAKRIYGQNFMPYYNIGGIVKNIKYQIKYSFDLKNKETNEIETFNKVINYSEDLIIFDDKANYLETFEDYTFEFLDCSIDGEKNNRYKLNMFINNNKEGHIDMQSFIECKDGKVYPYLGIYHYNLERGSFNSVSDDKLDKVYEISKVYYIINYYDLNGELTQYYYYQQI